MISFFLFELILPVCMLIYCLHVFRLCHALNEDARKPLTVNAATLPRISLIVPIKYNASACSLCLQSLAQQAYPHDKMEVVVVNVRRAGKNYRVVSAKFFTGAHKHSISR